MNKNSLTDEYYKRLRYTGETLLETIKRVDTKRWIRENKLAKVGASVVRLKDKL